MEYQLLQQLGRNFTVEYQLFQRVCWNFTKLFVGVFVPHHGNHFVRERSIDVFWSEVQLARWGNFIGSSLERVITLALDS